MPCIAIGHRVVGDGEPYVIAEIGVNHEGRLDLAVEMITLAAAGGADAVKFQTYKAATLAARESASYWDTAKEPARSQFELFSRYDGFGETEYQLLAEECSVRGVDFLSTPFDEGAVDFLAPLMPCIKVASADITNVSLLRKIAAIGKPVLLSCGASTLAETREAVHLLLEVGAPSLALLHCVLNYPTSDANANLLMIRDLREAFPDLVIGYSDHTVPDESMTALTAAYMAGADIIEKHFTYDKSLPGNDHYHAMDSADLARFRQRLDLTRKLAGTAGKRALDSERPARMNARRSVVLAKDVHSGESLCKATVAKRPGTGITAANYDEVLGMSAARDLPSDHILMWSDVMRAGGERTVAVLDLGGAKNRLPHFEMAELGGFRLIDWVIERVRQASTIDELLVAIPDGEDDGLLTHLAVEHAVSVVRGPRDDALHHIVTAARRSRADVIVCVSVANPLVDPVEIDRVVRFFRASRPDCACEDASDYCASGLAGPVVSRAALEYLEMCVTDPQSRECATLVSLASAENLRVEAARPPSVLASSDVKLDIVTEADLGRLRGLLSLVQQEERHAGDPRSLPATAFVAAWREQQRRGHH